MANLPPSAKQLEEAKKVREIIGDELNADDFDDNLQNDEIFELWDNIATDEYVRQGGKFESDDPNEPADSRFFEDCQKYATDLICELKI